MGEYEPGRLTKAEEPLLVLEDKLIGINGILAVCRIRAAAGGRINHVMALLVYAEVAVVHAASWPSFKVRHILRIKEIRVLRIMDNRVVLLLEDPLVLAFLIRLVIVLVLLHLVNEEKAQGLDALVEQILLLLKVAPDGLPDLDAPDLVLAEVIRNLAFMELKP